MTTNTPTIPAPRVRTQTKKSRFSWRKAFLIVFVLSILAAITPFAWRGLMTSWAGRYTYTPQALPEEHSNIAIVYGARVYPSGRLSAMLRDRVQTAVNLYHAGEIDTIVMSGDGRDARYNEPGFMANYAIDRGVPPEAIMIDNLGLRTYDSCYNAEVMGVNNAVLITQEFHLPRAIVTCQSLGVSAVGVIADIQSYSDRSLEYSTTREFFASQVALLDILAQQPPTGTGQSAIFANAE